MLFWCLTGAFWIPGPPAVGAHVVGRGWLCPRHPDQTRRPLTLPPAPQGPPLTRAVVWERDEGLDARSPAPPRGFVLEAPGEAAAPPVQLPAGRAPRQRRGWLAAVAASPSALGHGDRSSCSRPAGGGRQAGDSAPGLSQGLLQLRVACSAGPFGWDEGLSRVPQRPLTCCRRPSSPSPPPPS